MGGDAFDADAGQQLVAGLVGLAAQEGAQRRQRQASTAVQTAGGLAQQGLLHEQPDEVLQGYQRILGPENFAAFVAQSQQSAPLTRARQGLSDQITRVDESRTVEQAVPEGQFGPGAPLEIESFREATPGETAQNLFNLNPDQLAFVTGNNALGTLAAGAQNRASNARQLDQADRRLDQAEQQFGLQTQQLELQRQQLEQKQQAFEQKLTERDTDQFEALDDNGQPAIFVRSTDAQGNITAVTQIGIAPAGSQVERLQQRRDRLIEQHAAAPQGPRKDKLRRQLLETSNILEGEIRGDTGTVTMTGVDPSTGQPFTIQGPAQMVGQIQRLNLVARVGTGKELTDARAELRAWENTDSLIAEIEGTADNNNVGLIGTFNRLANNLGASAIQSPTFVREVQRIVGLAQGELSSGFDPAAREALLKRINNEPNRLAQLNLALAIQITKARDPGVSAREGEVNTVLQNMAAQGFTSSLPGFLGAIEGFKIESRIKQDAARNAISRIESRLGEQIGLLGQPQQAPASPLEPIPGVTDSAVSPTPPQSPATSAPPSTTSVTEPPAPALSAPAPAQPTPGAIGQGTSADGSGPGEVIPGIARTAPLSQIPDDAVAEVAFFLGVKPEALAAVKAQRPELTFEQIETMMRTRRPANVNQ